MCEDPDTELLMAAKTDIGVFRLLFERWSVPMLRYFYQRTFDAEASADLVSETFATALLRLPKFRDVGAPGGSWLYGIARRELGRYRRRRAVENRALRRLGVERPELDPVSFSRIEELVDAQRYRAALQDGLARLSEKERHAVALRVVEELSYRQVAEALGCSENAARVRVHRALRRLAKWLEAPA